MWTQDSTLLLLLACCFWSAGAQSERRQSIWEDPIQFRTQAPDLCTMIITGHGEYTRLRLSCQSSDSSYWCEYMGKPHTCRPYNKNPRHYFIQMTWGLRKLHNACQGPKQIKPQMCRKATIDSQMVFSSASFSHSEPEALSRTRPAAQPAKPLPQPAPTRHSSRFPQRQKNTPRISQEPATIDSNAKRIARQYCWRSLQGICSYFIGVFGK